MINFLINISSVPTFKSEENRLDHSTQARLVKMYIVRDHKVQLFPHLSPSHSPDEALYHTNIGTHWTGCSQNGVRAILIEVQLELCLSGLHLEVLSTQCGSVSLSSPLNRAFCPSGSLFHH